ncbi:MAG: protein kinase [Planctomycetes bacterium]|nr:protein kinase [Planctomycetota bacterium]
MSEARTPPAGSAPPPSAQRAVAGRFELLQELGSGSSGQVYRASLLQPYGELPTGTEVAVKFLRQELVDDERAQARLFAEGELGQQLRHPNVAAIYGVETAELLGTTITYLVMQYVRGTTLRQFTARSGQPVEDLTRRIGADAGKGLWALHRRGLVHRDVKPENLILTPESELKIVDLGLARPFGARGGGSGSGSGSAGSTGSQGRSSSHGLAGSIAYTAPEILRGEPASPKSDLYALGVVLYEVTTSVHPFAAATSPDAMFDAHLHRAPSPPSHHRARVSPFLEQILLDLLHKDPERRIRDAAELARLLEQGEHSDWWRKHEQKAPVLASSRRLLRMRRPAETPFHGRSNELEALDAALAAARAGKGRAVVIAGPDGIGRRRLLDEAMQRWLDQPKPPLYLGGEADSDLGHGEPFAGSVLDLLLRGDDRNSPNAAQRAHNGARTLLQLDDDAATALVAVAFGTSTEPPEVRADRLASALLRLPRRDQVLVLRVDHANQLDTSGRLVLQRLLAAAGRLHLMLLLTTGADGLDLPAAQRLDLAGLDEADFLAFGRALFAAGEPVEPFLRRAHQVLSGLPGNLIEMLDHLSQSGTVRGRAGDYQLLEPDAEPRPAPSHLERFRTRVAGLDPSQRAVLAAAAVLGERCELADLAALVQAPELSVLETLSLFRGRIVRAQGGEVTFRHGDFQKALLRELPPLERERLHRSAAAMLQAQGRSPLAIGMHLSMALDHEACLDPLLAGLDERVRAGSRRTALRLCGRLAVHLGQVVPTTANERRRLRFLLLAAEARANADQIDAAIRTFRQAETLARELGDLHASATARTGLASGELDSGRLLSAIALLESVHDDLAQQHDPRSEALAAKAHGLHGRILLYRGQASEGLKHLQAAQKRVPAEATDLRCHLRIDLARVEALSHHYPTALKTLQEVEQEPQSRNLPRARLRFHLYRGQMRALVGADDAAQDLRYAIDEAERLSMPTYGARAAVFLGERQFWRRRDDEAAAAFRTALRLARAGNDRLGEAMARSYLVRLGAEDPELWALVQELELPSLRANLLLADAAKTTDADQLAAIGEQLEQLLDAADLPLSLHLRALALLDRPASARSLVRIISERFPQRAMRRRFVDQWAVGARV